MNKKQEQNLDLKRYWKLLPKQDVYEVREFFYNGIISLDDSLNEILSVWPNIAEIIQDLQETPYSYSEIANWCCVDTEYVKMMLDFEIPTDHALKRIYIGIETYERN